MDAQLTWIRSILATTPDRWTALTAAADADLLTRPPAPGEWSALQCLQHLVDIEEAVFQSRVDAIIAGRAFATFDPDADGSAPVAAGDAPELAARFAAARSRGLDRVSRVTADQLGLVGQHQELGPVTLAQLLNQWAGHDLMHTVQAERALMQPFVAGSGPWRHSFTDHDVSPAT